MDKLKDIKVKAIYQALISNDYPSKMSKSFITKVMSKINLLEQSNTPFNKINKVVLRFASIFIFAVLTLYVLNYQDNKIEYSKTNIQITSPSQAENVSNQIDSCEKNKDSSTVEKEIACD